MQQQDPEWMSICQEDTTANIMRMHNEMQHQTGQSSWVPTLNTIKVERTQDLRLYRRFNDEEVRRLNRRKRIGIPNWKINSSVPLEMAVNDTYKQ